MRKVRTVLAAIVVTTVGIGIHATIQSPLGSDDVSTATVCWWVDGTLHCDS